MLGLSNRVAGRVSVIQRKVSVEARRSGGGSSFGSLSAKLNTARKQLARARAGR